MSKQPYLSIIIPAYNEEDRLSDTLAVVREWVEEQDFSVEVLVVDDGSGDRTKEVAERVAKRFAEVRVISYRPNRGKGGAVREGMLQATGHWRLFTDADSSTPIQEVEKLLANTERYQVIIGSRYLNPDSIKIKQPLKRRIISRLWNALIQLVLLPGIRDTQCGFKLFSAEVAEAVFARQVVNGWLFDVELLTIARELGYAVKEVPVDWYDARQSKLRAIKHAWRSMKDIKEIRERARSGFYQKNYKQSSNHGAMPITTQTNWRLYWILLAILVLALVTAILVYAFRDASNQEPVSELSPVPSIEATASPSPNVEVIEPASPTPAPTVTPTSTSTAENELPESAQSFIQAFYAAYAARDKEVLEASFTEDKNVEEASLRSRLFTGFDEKGNPGGPTLFVTNTAEQVTTGYTILSTTSSGGNWTIRVQEQRTSSSGQGTVTTVLDLVPQGDTWRINSYRHVNGEGKYDGFITY